MTLALVDQPEPGFVEISATAYEAVCRDLEQDMDEAIRNGLPVVAGEKAQLLVLLGWNQS